MKSKKEDKPACSACGCKHYKVKLSDKDIPPEIYKPVFTCLNGNCNHSWSYGKDGKPYIDHAKITEP